MKVSYVSHGLQILIRICIAVIGMFMVFLLLFCFCNFIGSHPFDDVTNKWETSSNIIDQLCPYFSPKLIGWTNIHEFIMTEKPPKIHSNEMRKAGVTAGGRYEPSECRSRHKIAVVVPVRNRSRHLAIFTRYMHPFLQRQQLDYTVIVVEQSHGSPFNRGMLMNIGFVEAQMQDQYQCFIFHDVDLLPEHDSNPYICPEDGKPRQMSFSIDCRNNYRPTLRKHFGGVTALSVHDFQSLNGYSNVFWGWGGEDDQLYERVKFNNMTVTRAFDDQPSLIHLTKYKCLSHPKAKPNPDRLRLLEEGIVRYKSDGLSNLRYKRLGLQRKLLYTHVWVDIRPETSSIVSRISD